jgi:NAD-dependent SIR2 family protein deacetylase
MLHGDITNLKCFNNCGYAEKHVTRDPLCEALAPASAPLPPGQVLPLLDPDNPLPSVSKEDLPQCPGCSQALLRPDVVWFGEHLDEFMLEDIESWIDEGKIDVMLVVGTSAVVQPAADYVWQAKNTGATVVVINPDPDSQQGVGNDDFFLQGDAGDILSQLLEGMTETRDKSQ